MNQNSSQDKRIFILSQEQPARAVLRMGLPVTMGMLFMVVYNLVDTYFIGMLHNDSQLAATNLSYPVMMVMVAVSGIVGNGGASYIARCMGAGEEKRARHTLTIGFELIAAFSLLLTMVGMVFLDPIVTILGAKESTFDFTRQYVSVMLIGSFFTMGNYAFGQLLRSEGSTSYSMVAMLSGTLTNIILDPVFIFLLNLGVLGAAIATVIGNAVGTVICVLCYASGKTLLRPSRSLMKLDLGIIREILWVGIPHTLEQFFTTAAMIVCNNLAAGYGETTVAAMGISSKIMSFGNYVYQGFAAGCQPLMGYNYGAKNYRRMKQLVRAGIAVTTGVELCIVVLFGVTAPVLIGAFSNSPEVIRLGSMALRSAMLMLPFVGSTSITRNTYNAIGKPYYAFSITVVRQMVLYIPFLLLFNRFWGFNGLIHAQPVEEMLCMVLALGLLFSTLNRLEQKAE